MEVIDLVAEFIARDRQFVYLSIIMLTTVLVVFSILMLLVGGRSPLKARLQEVSKSNQLKKTRKFENTLEALAPAVASSNSKESQSIRQKLMYAGYHDSSALTTFYALKALSIVLGGAAAFAFYVLNPDSSNRLLFILVSVSAGLYLPNIYLAHLVKKRQSRIRGGVPDALDLLVVCTESGLGFNAALKRVTDELALSHPDFADELDTVCAKVKAGVELSDAFDELVVRTGVSELNGLVTMLSHASRIGGSLAQSLRDYTEDFRDKRNQEVEEMAAKVPTKMLFPLLLFIWPCFFIVAVGPSLLKLSDTLGL